MRTHVIAAIGHVALQVRDLDAAVDHAVGVMGLRETERTADRVDLTHGAPHHSLQYLRSDVDAVDHVGLEAAGPEAVAVIRSRLEARGIPLLTDGPLDDCLTDGLSFVAPGGFVFEVYTGMPQDQPPYLATGVRPKRFGHVNFGLEDPQPMIDLLLDVLDFRISDSFRGGAFTRCNAEHHGIGVLKGRGILAHHAWEVEGIADLGRLGDVLDDLGTNVLAGPVRHGMGNNIAAYMAGPGDILIEYYCDMLRIYDDSTYVPGVWAEDGHKWYSRWSPDLPGPAARELGAPPAPRRIEHKERA
ncbi:MAG TPA: VOC family protein [Baekduia sp.]